MPRQPGPEEFTTAPAAELERIRELGATEPRLVGPSEGGEPTAELIAGHCVILGQPHLLSEPVDWRQDPRESRSWRYELHSFTWMRPLLSAYAADDEDAALAKARSLLLDWADTHIEPSDEISEFAWYDMAVGLRAPYFAFVLRQSLVDHGPREGDELLLRAALRHGEELADEGNYYAAHNHGLFQDEGLYMLASMLPTLPESERWRELASRRLGGTLAGTVDLTEGVHLEHSSAYQFTIANMVSRLAENVPDLPELPELRDRLRETATWHVTPAGRLAQLGDTDDVAAPAWATEPASSPHGLKAFYAGGQAFVRDGASYLAVSAAHHSQAHKHSDDTGFILVEDGVTILGDTGRWGYYEQEPDRVYARSAHAHNVLTVDERDFDREYNSYGSGLVAAGSGDAWHAIVARNPLLARQGVIHRRFFLYRPGTALIVIDDVRSPLDHHYARRFHFGRELAAELEGEGRVALTGGGISAALADHGAAPEIELDRGRDAPSRGGWTYPADRERNPVWMATFRTRAASATLAATVAIGDSAPAVRDVAVAHSKATIYLDDGSTLAVRLNGRCASVASASQ